VQRQVDAVRNALNTHLSPGPIRCLPTTEAGQPGPCGEAPGLAGPDDVERVRQVLDAAGFTGAVVRLATNEDPAPTGTVVYAVPAGFGCVLGYRRGLEGSDVAAGIRADGSCLSP
jgi:hypothetical protein